MKTDGKSKNQKLEKILGKDHYYYDTRSSIIYYLRKTQGEIVKFTTGVPYKAGQDNSRAFIKAARIVSQKEKEKQDEKVRANPLQRLIGEHLDEMVERLTKEGRSEGTLTSYRNSVRHLKEYFDGHLPDEVTDDEWLNFTQHFKKKNPGFILFNVTKTFRALCINLHKHGIMKKRPRIFNPEKRKEEARRKMRRHRAYTPEEIKQMDAVCNDHQRLVLWLGYDMGFRLQDCVGLTWDRVHLSKKTAYIRFFGDENKTGFSGRVPLSDTCADLLRTRRAHSKSDWVFPLLNDAKSPMRAQAICFEEVVRKSNVNYGSAHLLRHTRLTEDFGNKDLPDTLVMKIRRVSLAIAMEHYIHPTDEDLEKFRNTGKAKKGKWEGPAQMVTNRNLFKNKSE